jgi:hypothetical protein
LFAALGLLNTHTALILKPALGGRRRPDHG